LNFSIDLGGLKMPEDKSSKKVQEGYKPIPTRKGYRPSRGNLDTSNPPTGGSGVPSKSQTDTGKTSKK